MGRRGEVKEQPGACARAGEGSMSEQIQLFWGGSCQFRVCTVNYDSDDVNLVPPQTSSAFSFFPPSRRSHLSLCPKYIAHSAPLAFGKVPRCIRPCRTPLSHHRWAGLFCPLLPARSPSVHPVASIGREHRADQARVRESVEVLAFGVLLSRAPLCTGNQHTRGRYRASSRR